MKICRKAVAKGRVQGVFFRQGTYKQAIKLGVTGWVRNLDSGDVECLICGEEKNIQDMLTWLRKGPPAAKVNELIVEEHPVEEIQDFEIRR